MQRLLIRLEMIAATAFSGLPTRRPGCRRERPPEIRKWVTSLEHRALVGQHPDAGIEACQEPRDPRRSNALGKPALEPRDRRLRQSGSSGKRALAQAAFRPKLSKHLAQQLEGLPRRFVESADRS